MMGIEKLTGINAIQNVQGSRRTNGTEKFGRIEDSVSVSAEAKAMAETYYMKQVASETPNVRADKIAEIKSKIQNPNYLNESVIASAANRIMESFGL